MKKKGVEKLTINKNKEKIPKYSREKNLLVIKNQNNIGLLNSTWKLKDIEYCQNSGRISFQSRILFLDELSVKAEGKIKEC